MLHEFFFFSLISYNAIQTETFKLSKTINMVISSIVVLMMVALVVQYRVMTNREPG